VPRCELQPGFISSGSRQSQALKERARGASSVWAAVAVARQSPGGDGSFDAVTGVDMAEESSGTRGRAYAGCSLLNCSACSSS
jgi:hypothetical protein